MSHYSSIDTDLLRSFVAIADNGGFTRAAEVLNRTQSAVSMQMKRLETDVVQRPLFERDGRNLRLTAEGQILLGYARRILKLHGEVLNTLRAPQMVGSVKIGTPDDYLMPFLPSILARFAQAYPLVQVEVHCEPTWQLLQRHDLDLSIITRPPGRDIGQVLRQEQLVWAAAQGFNPHEQSPIPLATFNGACFFRTWACNALDEIGRDYRIAYTSPSLQALLAITGAGLAVTAQLQSLLPAQLRVLGEAEGLPNLAKATIALLRHNQRHSQVIESLAQYIADGFRP